MSTRLKPQTRATFNAPFPKPRITPRTPTAPGTSWWADAGASRAEFRAAYDREQGRMNGLTTTYLPPSTVDPFSR